MTVPPLHRIRSLRTVTFAVVAALVPLLPLAATAQHHHHHHHHQQYDETVAWAQRVLARMGFYHGSIDGVFGRETGAAILEFQHRENLRETGRLDHATMDALRAH